MVAVPSGSRRHAQVLVTTVTRPTQNLGILDEGAIRRMASGMRSRFDDGD